MRYLRTVGMVFAADILALFISLTLAGSSLWLIKAVSAVCGAGILIIIMSSFCVKTAAEDCRLERTGDGGGGTLTGILMGLSASAPGLLSWGALALSVKNGFEFYRWHKLLNGFFLQIFNFIESDASSSALEMGEVLVMGPLAIVPGLITAAVYIGALRKSK